MDSGSDTSDSEDAKTPKPVKNKKQSVTKRVKYTNIPFYIFVSQISEWFLR